MNSAPDRELVERLQSELDQIHAGLSRLDPKRDWSPIILKGKLGALAGLVGEFMGRALESDGLSAAEQQALAILRSGYTSNPSDLARLTSQTRAGMSRTIDRLVARGLVDRSHDTRDRRRVVLALTRRGRRVTDRKHERDFDDLDALLDGLDEPELHEITAAVDELLARLGGVCRKKKWSKNAA